MKIEEEVVVGAFLHDIGKLVMRGKNEKINHSHCGYEYLKSKNINNKNILDCVKYHHAKYMKEVDKNSIANIVYVADNIAAAIDRRDDLDYSGEDNSNQWKKDITLQSIFNVFKSDINDDKKYYTLDVFKGSNSIIDNLTSDENKVNDISIYSKIYNEFDSAFSRIDFENDSLASIFKVMEYTTNFVPSSTNKREVSDISLFNHSKVTAMIASCIYAFFKTNNIENYQKECFSKDIYDKKMFMLVSGDMSGIQNFIYNASEKKALKMLRGRSFYLELMIEHIIDEILEKLNLSRANLLYSGGGHFYMVLPNTERNKSLLKEATEKVNDFLMNEFNNVLSMSIGYSECTANMLMNSNNENKSENVLGEVFRNTSQNISRHKLSKYSKSQLKELFNGKQLNDENRNKRECSICRTTHKLEDENCKVCNSSIILGGEIPKLDKKLIIVKTCDKSSLFSLPSLNDKSKFLNIVSMEEAKRLLENSIVTRVYSVNNLIAGEGVANNLWVGNYSKTSDEEKYTFTNFSDFSKKSTGINRLGVLRMDIDDLGTAISSGFVNKSNENYKDKYQYVSLSRSSALSYNLSIFFKNEINKICKTGKKFTLPNNDKKGEERNISIVYSGGDDLFVVGAWDEVIEFAVDVNDYFKEFTNNKLTLSAGFSMFTHNYPIYQMAKITGDLESIAKRIDGKNAISLFGAEKLKYNHTYKWEDFKEDVCNDKLQFLFDNLHISDNGKSEEKLNIGTSMIYKLLYLLRNIDNNDNINLARMAYTLARIEPHKKENKKDIYNNFKNKIYNYAKNNKERKKLITAIYLYVYLNRKED